jgi:hypothetical protein
MASSARILLPIALAALALPASAGTAGAASKTVVVCSAGDGVVYTFRSRPKRCTFVYPERNGFTEVARLRWRRWGEKKTVARGRVYPKGSDPYRVRVVLRERTPTACGFRSYMRVTIRALSGDFPSIIVKNEPLYSACQ